jgi:hypothetical protein
MEMKRLIIMALVLGCSSSRPSSGGPDGSVDSGPSDALGSMPDGNGCATQPCDILTQCGCSSLESCDLSDSDNGTACRGTSGGVEGSSCGISTACAARYTCAFLGDAGSCLRYCASNADCIAPRGQCAIQLLDSADQPIPGALLCTSNCDPIAISNPLCPAGWSCDAFTVGSHQIADCRVAGTGVQGQACSDAAPCAAGFTCITLSATASQCRRICSPPANTGCPASTTCAAFTPPFVVGGTQYGQCV